MADIKLAGIENVYTQPEADKTTWNRSNKLAEINRPVVTIVTTGRLISASLLRRQLITPESAVPAYAIPTDTVPTD